MKTLGLTALSAVLALVGCDENPTVPPYGDLSVRATAPTIREGFATVDGWGVRYTRFFVNVSAVTVAGNDGVVAASAEAQLLDLASPMTPDLLSATNRVARAWENVSLAIAPATEETSLLGEVAEDVRAEMVAGGYSVFVEATMTRGAEVKTLRAGFGPSTTYSGCTATVGDVPVPGLVVPERGSDRPELGFRGDVLFFDNLVTRGNVLRGNPIAAADTNADGVIDGAELGAASLEALRTAQAGQGLYESATPDIVDLRGFLGEQARSIVATFRENGRCTPSVTAPSEE